MQLFSLPDGQADITDPGRISNVVSSCDIDFLQDISHCSVSTRIQWKRVNVATGRGSTVEDIDITKQWK